MQTKWLILYGFLLMDSILIGNMILKDSTPKTYMECFPSDNSDYGFNPAPCYETINRPVGQNDYHPNADIMKNIDKFQ
jgi:hypothetical protein